MKKKTCLTALLLACLVLCACEAQPHDAVQNSDDDLIVVGFSQVGGGSDWRTAHTDSMVQALSIENGYRLIFEDAQQKQEKQITAIRNFINLGVDYIILAPTTEKGWETVLKEAKAADIPVIIVDRMIDVEDTDLFTCWVGSDVYKEGEMAVQWMEEHLQGIPLRIVHLQGAIGSSSQLGRTAGLDDGLARMKNWQLVYRETGLFTEAKGLELVRALLEKHVNFNVIYAENDSMAFGAIAALKEAGIAPGKDVTVVSFDGARRALQMLLDGEINFEVECNPLHGPLVRDIIDQMQRGEKPPKYTFVKESFFDSGSLTEETIKNRSY